MPATTVTTTARIPNNRPINTSRAIIGGKTFRCGRKTTVEHISRQGTNGLKLAPTFIQAPHRNVFTMTQATNLAVLGGGGGMSEARQALLRQNHRQIRHIVSLNRTVRR